MIIRSEEELRELYGWPKGRAETKVLKELEKHSINFIRNSPFLMLASYDRQGKADASPRGGSPGFVKILNERTLLIPDSKGNNRVDSLINIVETGKVGCLFLIPGIDETLRVNGTAKVSIEEEYLNMFASEANPPKTCLIIEIDELFLHCAKALMRSKLWSEDYKQSRPEFPTMGKMLKDQLNSTAALETQEDMVKRYLKDL